MKEVEVIPVVIGALGPTWFYHNNAQGVNCVVKHKPIVPWLVTLGHCLLWWFLKTLARGVYVQCHKLGVVFSSPTYIFKDANMTVLVNEQKRNISLIMKKCRIHYNEVRGNILLDKTNRTELVYVMLQDLRELHLWKSRLIRKISGSCTPPPPQKKRTAFLTKGAPPPEPSLEITSDRLFNFRVTQSVYNELFENQRIGVISRKRYVCHSTQAVYYHNSVKVMW